MSATSDKLGKQAKELTEDLQKLGGTVGDAAQEKLGQVSERASEYCEQGRRQSPWRRVCLRAIPPAKAADVPYCSRQASAGCLVAFGSAAERATGVSNLPIPFMKGDTMTNQQILEGNWNEMKGMLRQKWGQLTDSDLPQICGDVDQIVGIIQRRTGERREAIEQYLQEMSGSAASAIGTAAETVRDYAQHAAETVQHTAKQAADRVHAGYDEAERFVRDRPGESLLVCFGVGLITGVVIALSLRSR